jgi:hypothetical protein
LIPSGVDPVWGWAKTHCWVLRRHPVCWWVFFLAAPGLDHLTHACAETWGGVVVVGVGWGVVVC